VLNEPFVATADWYERWKLLHGIADGPEVVGRIPLECNMDLLQYVSFAKGCYIGQELTARTKFKVSSL
jgi:transferase CAF17, mitochondrial